MLDSQDKKSKKEFSGTETKISKENGTKKQPKTKELYPIGCSWCPVNSEGLLWPNP